MEWTVIIWVAQQLLCGLPAAIMSGAAALGGVKRALKKLHCPHLPD